MNLEEIEELLLRVSELVRVQEQLPFNFAEDVKAWLALLENALKANRLFQAGNVGALRSALVSAERGLIPDGLAFRGRPTRRRVLNTVASDVLQRAVEMASNLMQENRPRLAEAERVGRQIVALARIKGRIPASPGRIEHEQYLRGLWRSLSASPDLEQAIVHLEGLVGPRDALVILDRALTPETLGAPTAVRSGETSSTA